MAGASPASRLRHSCLSVMAGLAGLILAEVALAAPVNLKRLDLANSTCMDGTPAAIYYDENATSSDKWMIMLQGSNLCSNVAADEQIEAATVAQCARWCFANKATPTMPLDLTGRTDDAHPGFGAPDGLCDSLHASSSQWTPMLRKGALFDDDPNDNPGLHDAQKIYVRSCSGDGWMGAATGVPVNDPVSTPLTSFNFHGRLIIEEVVDLLTDPDPTVGIVLADSTIPKITTGDGDLVLFGGESRGAQGTWGTIDHACDRLAAASSDVTCRGVSASYFPGLYKPKWRQDPQTFQPVPTQTFKQWADVRKRRYAFQGIAHSPNCNATFPEALLPLNPVTPYHLNIDDTSREMCYTDLGLLLSVTTPTFVSFNRFDNVGDYDWQAGCDPTASQPLRGGPDCFNNQLAREAGIKAIAGRLPASFVSYFPAANRHLYLLAESCQSDDDACWTDPNCLGLGSSCSTDTLSKADVLEQWLRGNLAGEIFWDIADKYPFD